jgi:hypothetical protein
MTFARKPLVLAGLAAALVAAGIGARQAQATTTTQWAVTFVHQYGAAGDENAYLSVAAPSASDVWAFGGSNGQAGSPVAVQYTGGQWVQSTLPHKAGLAEISAASAPSASDVWALTSLGSRQSALTWNGSAWSIAHTWNKSGDQTTGITAFSPGNVWVFGATTGDSTGIGTWHFNGSTWAKVDGAATGIITASALSSSDIWAVGAKGSGQQPDVVHYNGTSWRQVSAPSLTGGELTDVLAVSDSDVWVLGHTSASTSVLEQYNGTSWTSVTIPWTMSPAHIASDGAGGLWLSGTDENPPNNTWLLHQSASGTWTRQVINPQRAQLTGLALLPGTTTLVGAGTTFRSEHVKAAVYLNGTLGS